MSGPAKYIVLKGRRLISLVARRLRGPRAVVDPARDRARIRKALSKRLSAHLLKDVGGDG
jgi:uncharacterized protein YjiS (DUF1127 family)